VERGGGGKQAVERKKKGRAVSGGDHWDDSPVAGHFHLDSM
jgi:hypothetical protein